jgi:hypothetical protein
MEPVAGAMPCGWVAESGCNRMKANVTNHEPMMKGSWDPIAGEVDMIRRNAVKSTEALIPPGDELCLVVSGTLANEGTVWRTRLISREARTSRASCRRHAKTILVLIRSGSVHAYRNFSGDDQLISMVMSGLCKPVL